MINEKIQKRINFLNNSKDLKIIFDIKYGNRTFPKKNKFIKFENINGGYTSINSNEIFIVRHEEYPKVILHEIIHHNPLIHSDKWKKKNIIKLKKHFNIDSKTDLEPNEAIVEFWATIMHLYFISIENNLNIKKLLKDEIKYSLFKSNQLLNHLDGKWNEETNAYCYIIFKTIMLYNLKDFMKIYHFPYDDTKITDFLIKHSKLPIIKKNPFNKIPDESLRMMIYSDL